MRSIKAPLILLVVAICHVSTTRADLVQYHVPDTPLVVTLQGRTIVNPGGSVVFLHEKFGKLYLDLQNVRIYKVDSFPRQFRKQIGKAQRTQDPAETMQVADWALRRGLLDEFYEAIDATLELDPNQAEAVQVRKLKEQIDQPLEEKPELEETLRKAVKIPGMKIARSKHFILLHDTPEKPQGKQKKPRAQERLDLLELVYESFLLKFYSRGIELDIPDERLMVVLFNEYAMYKDYATNLSPELASASGFWSPSENISVFFDHGTAEEFKILNDLSKRQSQIAEEAIRIRALNAKQVVRYARTLELLLDVAQESSDIEVVSHEATHQMAGNTGLLPRDVRIPSWVHEGLATYFEAPNDASWAGIGAVNKQRLDWYRALASDREHSNIDFIVGDEIFDLAGSHGSILHAYGQAWALTHFLLENRLDDFTTYYRRLGEFPPDTPISAEVLRKVFAEVFGEDHESLELQWRDYMRGLKTDVELIIGEE